MDMSNTLVASGFKSTILTPANQTERQSKLPASSNPILPENRNPNKNQQRTDESVRVSSAEFIKKGEALQAERFQRLNALESAPLKSQQAVNSYQQTIDSAKQFEQGELVGIDLYV